jgi:hypothetical protein
MKTIVEYRKEFEESVKNITEDTRYHRAISLGKKGLITGNLNSYCRGDANRKQFLKALTGHSSSKDMTDAEWEALQWFLDPEAEGEIISKLGEIEIDKVIATAMPAQDKMF